MQVVWSQVSAKMVAASNTLCKLCSQAALSDNRNCMAFHKNSLLPLLLFFLSSALPECFSQASGPLQQISLLPGLPSKHIHPVWRHARPSKRLSGEFPERPQRLLRQNTASRNASRKAMPIAARRVRTDGCVIFEATPFWLSLKEHQKIC